jgi:hypothetical protein
MTPRPDDMDDELFGEPIDPSEQLEAERLARALEGRSERNAPQDALETGLLLRVLEDNALSPEREQAILDELLSAPVREQPRRRAWGWSLLWAGLGLSALSVLVVVDRGLVGSSAPPIAASLPEPSLELLRAQAAGLGGVQDPAYAAAKAEYRREILSSVRGGGGRR